VSGTSTGWGLFNCLFSIDVMNVRAGWWTFVKCDAGFKMQGARYKIQDTRYKIQDTGCKIQHPPFQVQVGALRPSPDGSKQSSVKHGVMGAPRSSAKLCPVPHGVALNPAKRGCETGILDSRCRRCTILSESGIWNPESVLRLS
jgi:hypothetical protein